jgi:hypothetical protein
VWFVAGCAAIQSGRGAGYLSLTAAPKVSTLGVAKCPHAFSSGHPTGAGTSFDSNFSRANGLVWMVDSAAGAWGGYPVALGLGCTVSVPPSPVTGDAAVTLTTSSVFSPTLDATFSFSTDAGATWAVRTPGPTSPIANPAVGIPISPAAFEWDSVADGEGLLSGHGYPHRGLGRRRQSHRAVHLPDLAIRPPSASASTLA